MNLRRIQIVTLVTFAVFLIGCNPTPQTTQDKESSSTSKADPYAYRVISKTEGTFDEIKEYLVSALQDRGLKVNNISHVSDMLQRTGKDLGRTKRIYQIAEAVTFCSAIVSRDMMEADADNIVFCPYIIYIYVKADEPGTVYLSYRRPNYTGDATTDKTLTALEELLKGIIADTVG